MQGRWKYVVFLDAEGDERIALFDPSTLHADYVARARIPVGRLVSAGFATADKECFGRSTSLGLSSRPRADTALLRGDDSD